jgi:hypothetical protein
VKKTAIVKVEPGGGAEPVPQASSDALTGNPAEPPKDSGNWFSRLFNGWRK